MSKLPDEAKRNRVRDPRLDELRAMGMHHCWQKVATEIGMDAFLVMWRILDAEEQWHHSKGGLEITLRRYRSYRMFQRNAYIKQLASMGCDAKTIALRLEWAFDERLEKSRVVQIIK
ncbi:hypothetical protein [Chromobacterium sp. ATCC 53434]|uniref:hypothetical protein n=1 Tax=Chromobacterium sp. (strain ATCC 53434 / SC 14030) TaxID=2059672 RepID=UPI0013051072|nr:hypothetical protein [Chromobacterium sp. ATCC 53434]